MNNNSIRGDQMRKGQQNPNSIQAVRELEMEIANELSIANLTETEVNKADSNQAEINKKLAERYRSNLIGFK